MNEIRAIAEVKVLANTIVAVPKSPIDLEDGEYEVTVKQIPRKRTLRQNAYLWALLGEIAKKEDGDLRDVERLYTMLLSRSGAKYEAVYLPHQGLMSLLEHKVIRHVQIMKQTVVRGVVYDTAYLFYGSSKMDTKEMANLIDVTLNYAAELGIYTPYWEHILKEN